MSTWTCIRLQFVRWAAALALGAIAIDSGRIAHRILADEPIRVDRAKAAQHARDCTVEIKARAGRTVSDGSGVVMSPDGRVLTAKHVIAGMETISLRFSDGSTLPARLLYQDDSWDLAVVQCAPTESLEYAYFEGHRESMFDDDYLICGNPGGRGKTTRNARLSKTLRKTVQWGGVKQDVASVEGAIEPGYSGGGFFNAGTGHLHGIIVAQSSRPNVGFVVPASDYLRFMVRHTVASKDDRTISQLQLSYGLGIWAAPAPMTSERYPMGLVVTHVHISGPARDAGWKVGDVLVSLNSFKMKTQENAAYVLEQVKGNGAELPAIVVRDGVAENRPIKAIAYNKEKFWDHLKVLQKRAMSYDEFDVNNVEKRAAIRN